MRHARLLVSLILLLLAPLAAAAGAEAGDAEASPDYGEVFEQLKARVGTWDGAGEGGNRSRVTYHVTGGVSALVESFHRAEGEGPSRA